MLDRQKLSFQIEQIALNLFPLLEDKKEIAEKKWKEISKDQSFVYRVENSKSSFLIPTWSGNLSDVFAISNDLKDYSVIAADGSQIYPDRHLSGAGCFLVNVGGCKIDYKDFVGSKVNFFSEPSVFLIADFFDENDSLFFSADLVDLKREELEFEKLFQEAKKDNQNPVCFVDGSLIFWHLEAKQQEIKDRFLNIYLSYLNQFYENQIPIAGYISFPRSKELVNLIKLGLCRFTLADCIACYREHDIFPCKQVDNLFDTQIAHFLLKPFERTTVFWSQSKIVQEYPEHLKPAFFYLNVGAEIVRLEIPSWVAQHPKYLDLICKVAIDQSQKGYGYPVVLAESHEQAVVKGPDRDFFFHLIQKIGIEQNKRFFVSQKSLKKRGLGI
jgi:hypothetical protein